MTIESSYPDNSIESPLPMIPMTRERRVARWISRIASPPLMAISGAALSAADISQRTSAGASAWWWAFFMVAFAVLIPSGFVFYLVKTRKITDFDVYLRQQRFWPYIVALVCGSLSWLILAVAHAPRLLIILSGASVSQGVIMFLINQRWKISAHAAGTASMAIIIWQILGMAGTPILLMIPIVGWSRVRLGRHSLRQVIAGSILGASVFLGALAVWY